MVAFITCLHKQIVWEFSEKTRKGSIQGRTGKSKAKSLALKFELIKS